MSILSNLFGGSGNSPAEAANKYLDQIPGTSHQSYDPYINRGQEAGSVLSKEYGNMAQNPEDVLNQMLTSYQPSAGYKFKQDQLGKAAANTAAAGGMRGSPQDQLSQQQLTQGLLNDDMQQWISNLMGTKQQGLAGEQNLYGTGFQASTGLNSDLTNNLASKASLGYKDAQDKNNKKQALIKALMSGIGSVGGSFLGPLGTSLGSSLGNMFDDTTENEFMNWMDN